MQAESGKQLDETFVLKSLIGDLLINFYHKIRVN